MPKRTNTFQDVVAIVQRHMAGDAHVEESAMVQPLRGGPPREVDVVVSARVGQHEVNVGIEASKTSRRATVEWVDRMIGKHADLPTDKVILYSGSGFTKEAERKAIANNMAVVAAEPVDDDSGEKLVLNGLRSIWPKLVSLTPDGARVVVRRENGSTEWFREPGSLALYFEDGIELEPSFRDCVMAKLGAQMDRVIEQLGVANIAESVESRFVLVWEPFSVLVDGEERRLFVRWQEEDPPRLRSIERVVIEGGARIEVQQVALTHARLGEVHLAYGEVTLSGRSGVVVATETGLMTIRLKNGD